MTEPALLRLPLRINGERYGEIEVYEDLIELYSDIFVLDKFDQPIECSVHGSEGSAIVLPGRIILPDEEEATDG